jgi:ABC-type uncharacterized transport system involved in gliding motility auxiliary subunit
MHGTTKKKLVEGSTLSAGMLVALALLGLVNYFGWKYYQRWDWTRTQIYSLSEKTTNVLKALPQDVTITAITSPESPLAEPVAEILARYAAASPRVQVKSLDPTKNLIEAQRVLDELGTGYAPSSVKVAVQLGAEKRVFEENDLAEFDFSAMQFGGGAQLGAFKGEQAITGALVELTSGERAQVLFTTGHGERKIDDVSPTGLQGLKALIGAENLEVEPWSSLGQAAVPAEADLLVVAGPKTAFTPPELAAFRTYLGGGGRMLWLLDPVLAAEGSFVDLGLGAFFSSFGVRLEEAVVVDPQRTVPFYGAETFGVSDFDAHPVVRSVGEGNLNVVFSLARPVARGTEAAGYRVAELARTSGDGWGERTLSGGGPVGKDAADVAGPVSLAVAVEASPSAGEEAGKGAARMVVVGDTDFATDALLASGGNSVLVNDLFNWLLAREQLLGIPAKKTEQVKLSLTGAQLSTIYLLVALLPLAAIAAGVAVYLKRRR